MTLPGIVVLIPGDGVHQRDQWTTRAMISVSYPPPTIAVLLSSAHLNEVAVNQAKATFPSLNSIPSQRITFSAVLVDYPDYGRVKIGSEVWGVASIGVDSFEVSGEDFSSMETGPLVSDAIVPAPPAAAGPPQVAGLEG